MLLFNSSQFFPFLNLSLTSSRFPPPILQICTDAQLPAILKAQWRMPFSSKWPHRNSRTSSVWAISISVVLLLVLGRFQQRWFGYLFTHTREGIEAFEQNSTSSWTLTVVYGLFHLIERDSPCFMQRAGQKALHNNLFSGLIREDQCTRLLILKQRVRPTLTGSHCLPYIFQSPPKL